MPPALSTASANPARAHAQTLVSVAERVLFLRTLPELGQVPVEDLAPLAACAREMSVRTRTVLVRRGEPTSAAYVALTGRMRALRDGSTLPGDPVTRAFGGDAMFSGTVFDADVVAEPGALLLVLDADVLLEALEDRPSLLRSLLRAFSASVLRLRGEGDPRPPRTPMSLPEQGWSPSPDLTERMFLLHEALQLRAGSLTVLAQLARAAELRVDPLGSQLWAAGSPVAEVRLVLDGELDLQPAGQPRRRAKRGHFLGLVEVLADSPWQHSARVATSCTSLVFPAAEVAAALEDHFPLGLEALRRLARESWLRRVGALALAVGR
jgi:CRP-like cAMP-binding protein